jgi:hypothetical protein
MVFSPSLTALVVSLSAWLGATFDAAPEPRQIVQQMVVRDEIIIHVPIAQRRMPAFEWVEHKGPKCLPAAMIAGAAMATRRASTSCFATAAGCARCSTADCAGLDFYGGFYIEPQDGAVCAKREEIRSRAGSTCRIERFKGLERKYKR